MSEWWEGISSLGRAFFSGAIFFSTLFIWQFAASLAGLGGDQGDVSQGDAEYGDVGAGDGDLIEDVSGLATLRLFSVRSILAFGMLFSWAGALYLSQGHTQLGAMIRAFLWGAAGMATVAFFFWMLPRLSEEGTASLDTAIGKIAKVYMNIPEGGSGQIRVMVSGTMSYVNAQTEDGRPLVAGTTVRVVRRLDARTLEIVQVES